MFDCIKKYFDLFYKSLKNPRLFVKVFNKRYLTIPSLSFLQKSKYNFIKLFYIKFWIFFSKKHRGFKKYFFNNTPYNEFRHFQFNDLDELGDNIKDCLAYNGIVIIEDVLGQNSLKDIENKIDLIEAQVKERNISRYSKNYNLLEKFSDDKKRKRLVCSDDIFFYKELNNLNNILTKEIYGKVLKPEKSLYIDYCYETPEKKVRGDNYLHIDRFLPNMKILYSPKEIDISNSPFEFSLNTHKINKFYIDYVLNAKNFDETDDNAFNFTKKRIAIKVKKNSAIIALTNGFHGRISFAKKGKRIILFHQYNRSFNKINFLI